MIQEIDLADLRVGDEVTVWQGSRGQGGRLILIADDHVTIQAPLAVYDYPLSTVTHFDVDRPGPPEECLEFSDECSGPVEMWWPGSGYRSWPRCTFHGERRLANCSELERYADSDVAPSWFREDDIGERWEDDY